MHGAYDTLGLEGLKVHSMAIDPEQRLLIIMDNMSAHASGDIVKWAKKSMVSFAPTSTNASWRNPIDVALGAYSDLY